jgi:serine/threonine-protein kinase
VSATFQPTAVNVAPPAGRLFVGRYRLRERIAGGGMGEVWLARDEGLDRLVAVKLVLQDLACDPSYLDRFRREAMVHARIKHEYVVHLYDYGTHPQPYMVMELVQGITLREALDQCLRFEWLDAVCVAIQIADALGGVHREGLHHRDVKPDNVLLAEGGHVKLCDLGIARDAAARRRGGTTDRIGSLGYLPPEMVRGEPVDHRGDFYQLGVLTYELLTGRKPYSDVDESSETEMQTAHARYTPDPIPPMVPDCPEALWRIVERLLAKRPEQRYQTARQIMNALGALLPREVPAGHRFEEVVQREIVRRTLRSRPPQEDEPAPSGPRLVKTERIGPDFVPVSPASPGAESPVPSTGRIPSSSLLPPAEIALTRPLPPEAPVPPEVPTRPGRAFPVSPSRARSMGRWHELAPVPRARGSTGRWHEEAPAPRALRSAGRWAPPPPAPLPRGIASGSGRAPIADSWATCPYSWSASRSSRSPPWWWSTRRWPERFMERPRRARRPRRSRGVSDEARSAQVHARRGGGGPPVQPRRDRGARAQGGAGARRREGRRSPGERPGARRGAARDEAVRSGGGHAAAMAEELEVGVRRRAGRRARPHRGSAGAGSAGKGRERSGEHERDAERRGGHRHGPGARAGGGDHGARRGCDAERDRGAERDGGSRAGAGSPAAATEAEARAAGRRGARRGPGAARHQPRFRSTVMREARR